MDLKVIKGLGAKRIELLKEKGIFSCEDLVMYFPKTYFDLNSKDTFSEDGKYKLLNSTVVSDVKVVRIRKNFNYSVAECLDINNNKFKAIWYNQPYIKQAVKNGDNLYLYGKNSLKKHGYFIVSTFKNKNKIKEGTTFYPVYKSYKNLGQSVLISSISQALDKVEIKSIIPKEFEQKNNLECLQDSIKTIHNPTDIESLKRDKERLDIEKILPIIKLSSDLKNANNNIKRQNNIEFSSVLNQFCSFLPYKLTNSQINCLNSIKEDLSKNKRMNRLIQGDVGSGKTIIALISALAEIKNGKSVIFLAPTEILAKQHYAEALKYFVNFSAKVSILSSSTKQGERKDIINTLKTEPMLLIGTHSCLSEDIDTSNVSLVIIDEQHRFGVKQRSAILSRAKDCDLLMLSATPIPRSLSIVYYGGLDISVLSEMPYPKLIQTNLVSSYKENDMWQFIKEKMQGGSKVYVVCANIDDSDDDCYTGLSAKGMFLSLKEMFKDYPVYLAHGKLDSVSEEKTLNAFKEGGAAILVSTTIVEVGIDIKEADIMVIVSPEKFGLATLHQLRGRIGRAGQMSYCFCMSKNLNEKSQERINFFKQHLSGFDIAEFDYNSRGAGEILSTKQHGRIDNPFELVSLSALKKAKSLFDALEKEYVNTDFLIDNLSSVNLQDIGLN